MRKMFSKGIYLAWFTLVFMACNNGDDKSSSGNKGTDSLTNKTMKTESMVMDAVKVAPNLYKVIKDTMGIRILEVNYKPGDSSLMHSHPDYVLYVTEGGKGEFTEKDGTKKVNEMTTGMTMIIPGGTHSVKNVGMNPIKALLFEVNRPNKAAPMKDPNLDAVKVAPNLYKKVADTMNIRILMATYKPGESSGNHGHPDNAIYIISGGESDQTPSGEIKQKVSLVSGASAVHPASSHSVKNTGHTTLKVLIVEVNRPGN